jgi:formylmethanofuran dehydrogenase subunit E
MPKVKTIRLSKGTPNKDLRMSNENEKLREEIKELHNMVDDLSGWVAGVEADNDTLRKDIARLKEERDLARREICRWEASATGKRITECAKLNEWDCFKNEKQHTYICDHCGETVDSDNAFHYAELPRDIASANKGESATLCRKCEEMIDANANNQDFRTTDMG